MSRADVGSDAFATFRRPAGEVMRLARMGSAHPTRLSFLRQLLRRAETEGWRIDRPVWDIDGRGVGRATYRVRGPEHSYTLAAFAHDLPDHMRSDRVIATAWDATFALVDGEPTPADLDRLAANVPLQEAGRIGPGELCLLRANRSVRLFDHVVARLAAGRQPDPAALAEVGYLMRTTAVYGSGKFGAADRAAVAGRPELAAPFQAEMLSVWLARAFTVDIVEHLARARGGDRAARLDPALARGLGVGNSTGLGMAPFLIRHPVLLNNWMAAREEALARVRAQTGVAEGAAEGFFQALLAAKANAADWDSAHPVQAGKLAALRADLETIGGWAAHGLDRGAAHPWDALWRRAEAELSLEGQEALLALMLEPHGDLVDGLGCCMAADEAAAFPLDGRMRCDAARTALADRYGWALDIDWDDPAELARFWYVSEEKLEPRLGRRAEEAGAERELPLGIARAAADCHAALADWPGAEPVAAFLLAHPEHRQMLRRVQMSAGRPYAEIRDNLLSASMLPIDILRCKLAFFGATRFDPRSDLWVRISLLQGAPDPREFGG